MDMARADHGYCEGKQHLRRNRYRLASFHTSVFFLQTAAAVQASPVTQGACDDLKCAFAPKHEAGGSGVGIGVGSIGVGRVGLEDNPQNGSKTAAATPAMRVGSRLTDIGAEKNGDGIDGERLRYAPQDVDLDAGTKTGARGGVHNGGGRKVAETAESAETTRKRRNRKRRRGGVPGGEGGGRGRQLPAAGAKWTWQSRGDDSKHERGGAGGTWEC